ncbi:hypothetical protein KC333_g5941 [Hortaea werneckii]|nr:hypothetical protein KC333_g5941 [Hortaea werneckii]KAI7312791.1 hypothetical protein KC326_g5778 [Hortaea werneckii]
MRFLLPVIAMSAAIQAAPSTPRDVNSIVDTGAGRTKEGLNKTINEVETLIEENINKYTLGTIDQQVENVEDSVSKRSVDNFIDTMFTRLQNGTSTIADEVSELVKQNINYYTLDTLQKQIENLEGTVTNKRSVDDFLDTMFTRLQNGTSTIADEVSELVKQNINYYTLDTLQKQIENLEGTVENKRAVDDVSDTVFQRLQGGTSQIADEVAKLVKQNINYYTLDTLQKQIKNLEGSVAERSVKAVRA